jgi:hypothetical protein
LANPALMSGRAGAPPFEVLLLLFELSAPLCSEIMEAGLDLPALLDLPSGEGDLPLLSATCSLLA